MFYLEPGTGKAALTVTREPEGIFPQLSLHEIRGTGLPTAVQVIVMVPPTDTVINGGGGTVTVGVTHPISSLRS